MQEQNFEHSQNKLAYHLIIQLIANDFKQLPFFRRKEGQLSWLKAFILHREHISKLLLRILLNLGSKTIP